MSLEWLGGFFDGEGCVRLDKQVRDCFYPQLSIVQKLPGVLKSIQKELGGRIYEHGGKYGGFVLRFTGSLAWNVAALLCSYCVEKRPQLEVLLESQATAPKDRAPFAARLKELKQTQSVYSEV